MDNSNAVFDVIKKRRSCRFFKKDADVSDAIVGKVIEAGRWAPSARNLQPIEFIVVRERERREKIAEFSRQPQPKESPVSIVVVGDLKRAVEVGNISPHDTTTHFKGLKMFLYMDSSAAIQNMLLMAEALGYASLWISSFDEDGLQEYLELPDRFAPVAVICLGLPAHEIQVPPKRPLKDRLHREKWSPKEQDESYIGFCKKINVKF